ncbi:MAG: hypothetical protein MZU97_24280 [Bacillus subtilis]|nr:hypothetical protein [Bacillus subtilis]
MLKYGYSTVQGDNPATDRRHGNATSCRRSLHQGSRNRNDRPRSKPSKHHFTTPHD